MIYNSETRFWLVSKLLHWIIAFCIIGLIVLGWWMVGLSYYDPWYHDSLELHKALGVVVLALACFKIGWQTFNRPPRASNNLSLFERVGSKVMHWTLYALMIVVPLTGYVITTASGQGVSMFGLFELPALLSKSDATRDVATAIHYYFAYAGIVLVAGHVGAALKHHFIDRDDTLKRMI
ncbi:MAG: cytochrome b [Hyphomicrobiales bacterium]